MDQEKQFNHVFPPELSFLSDIKTYKGSKKEKKKKQQQQHINHQGLNGGQIQPPRRGDKSITFQYVLQK